MIIHRSCVKGSFSIGMKMVANNRYIQGNKDPFLLNETRNAHMNVPVATIFSTVWYPYGRYGR